jgi:hypothetical protein
MLEEIDQLYPFRNNNPEQNASWHLLTAMMTAYARKYEQEPFEVICLEKKFKGEIINPATGACSKSFHLAGRVDGVVKEKSRYYLIEHKTASLIDGNYLEKLWADFQIQLYSIYIASELGIEISGVIYNILGKAKLRKSEGETEAEYEERKEGLAAKNKSGKSNATRNMPESDEEFQARLALKYQEPEMFHRELIYIDQSRLTAIQEELWELTKAYLDARRRDVFYQNTSYCFNFNRPCRYFDLCRANGNVKNLIDNFYEIREPHEELLDQPAEEVLAF